MTAIFDIRKEITQGQCCPPCLPLSLSSIFLPPSLGSIRHLIFEMLFEESVTCHDAD